MVPENPLSLLLDALREHEPSFVLATPEDANFFRSQVQRVTPVEKPKPEVFLSPPPFPLPPKPLFVTEKPAPSKSPAFKEEPPLAEPSAPTSLIGKGNSIEAIQTPSLTNQSRELSRSSPPSFEACSSTRPKLDFSLVRNLLSVVAPELAILNDIPNDEMARKVSQRWKTKNQTAPISVVCYQEPPEQRALLEGIVTALDVCFGPAKLVYAEAIEKEKQWETFLGVSELKMVIVCDYTLWQLHGLMHFYKEIPSQGVRTLGNVPLFLLPDLSLYLKDPLLKRSLWKALCQKFS